MPIIGNNFGNRPIAPPPMPMLNGGIMRAGMPSLFMTPPPSTIAFTTGACAGYGLGMLVGNPTAFRFLGKVITAPFKALWKGASWLGKNVLKPTGKFLWNKAIKPAGQFISNNILKPVGRWFKKLFSRS